MSINWPTTSQGPKKKSIQITKRRIDPCPAHTARNTGSFTTMVLWSVKSFNSSTAYGNGKIFKLVIMYLLINMLKKLYTKLQNDCITVFVALYWILST